MKHLTKIILGMSNKIKFNQIKIIMIFNKQIKKRP